jgi:hypothetical protein
MLIGFIIVGSAPIQPAAQFQQQEDCVVCGHACCCPEMCKPLIKKIKPEAASHCSTQQSRKRSKIESCDQPNSICRLQSAPPAGILNLKNEGGWPNLRFTVLADVNPSSRTSKESIFEARLSISFLVPLEIPIPPPRSFPA